MRKLKFLFLLLSFLGIGLPDAFSYDIAVENEQGTTIYYNYINSGKELEVARGSSNPNIHLYGGIIIIPEDVLYMNRWRKVTSVGTSAFSYEGISSVTVPNSVTSIGDAAFYECKNLTSVILPDGITHIGSQAFYNCEQLKTINLPTSLTSIERQTFTNTKNLSSIIIPDSVTSIGEYAFWKSGINSLTIGRSVVSLDPSCFTSCSNLTSVVIPNNVKYIGSGIFSGCSSLESVTLGRGVRSLGNVSFINCDKLANIISYIEEPFAIAGRDDYYGRTFSENSFFNATLYVPKGTIGKYQSTDGWKDFVWIEEFEPEEETVNVQTNATTGGYVLINGGRELNTSVEKGSSVTLEFVAEEGYILQRVTLNGEDITAQITDDTYVIDNVTENIDIIASFEEKTYLLTIQHADNGCLKQVIKRGSRVTCFIEPADGWIVHSVVFNSVDVTAQLDNEMMYMTPAINDDSRLSVVYELFDEDAITSVAESKAKVLGTSFGARVIDADMDDMISVYTADGKLHNTIKVDSQTIDIPLANDNMLYIIQVGSKKVKLRH